MGNDRIRMQCQFATTPQGVSVHRRNHRNFGIFQRQIQILAPPDIMAQLVVVVLACHPENETKIGPDRKRPGIVIADHHRAEPCRHRVQSPLQGVEDGGVHGVHLGAYFETGHAIAQIPDAGPVGLDHGFAGPGIRQDRRCDNRYAHPPAGNRKSQPA